IGTMLLSSSCAAPTSSRLAIERRHCQIVELCVGRFLFLEGRLQERHSLVESELLGPGDHRAIARDLVMFDRLRAGEQAGIDRLAVLALLHDLPALFNQA